MRLAGKSGIWPVATALATMLAIVVGLHADVTHARDEPKEHRKKAPIVRTPAAKAKILPQGKTAIGAPKRERATTTDRTLGPAKTKETKTRETRTKEKEHDSERRKTAKTDSRSKEPRKTRDGKALDSKAGTKSALTKAGPAVSRTDRSARRAVNAATPQLRQVQRATHRNDILAARARLPARPYPGERNFTGVPPSGETRFLTTEVMFNAGPGVTQPQIDDFARRHNCVAVWTGRSTLTGGTLIRFRITGGQNPTDMVRTMEAEQLGVVQPNYLYDVVQQQTAPASADQYVAGKLKLAEVHKIATGKGVLIAIIDSQIDAGHPELGSAIAENFEAIGMPDKPHTHGTGMLGAIVSQGKLMGVAPGAKALAIHAFATGSKQSPQATTQAIIAGLEFALEKGARIVNMSFAGPYDPMLQVALKKAAERGVILIAAVGNAGPKSPPLYPAADPHVIGVTATDQNDEPFAGANRGAYVAVAAPGVNIIAPAPEAAYQLTTGTSVAAAHVSGVAALLLERHPNADAATILEVLTASATKLTSDSRDDQVGWGLIDPSSALAELDARLADSTVATTAPTIPTPTPRPTPAPAANPTPAAAKSATSEKRALPRPGVYAPK
jgi:subtilisin family serine protease